MPTNSAKATKQGKPKGHIPESELQLPGGTWEKMEKHLKHVLRTVQSTHGFKGEYLEREIFSKFLDPKLVSPETRRSNAIVKWRKTEVKNARTNRFLLTLDEELGWCHTDRLVKEIRSLISRILGPCVWDDVLSLSSYTNGASTRVRRSPVAAVNKLTGVGHISSSSVVPWFMATDQNRLACQKMKVQESSVLFTVPKKSDIDRVACKEPEGNMFLQRSAGLFIRERLRKFGLDLRDQTVNQKLARDAYRDGLATVDLSAASDSVTKQLVILLLPFEWWSLLDDLRVKSTLIDGQIHELEMFSSMGNGFTFELESLLFYAITRVVCRLNGFRGRISVYGDDIICPSVAVPRLKRVLSLFGFTMNAKKTAYRGPFRESCGKHYYKGTDVTPFYVRKAVESVPELVNLLNHILEWDGRGWGFFLNREPYLFWLKWRSLVPTPLWGGIDPSDDSALVTGHRPNRRLVLRTRELSFDQEAGLTLWLLQTRHRDRDPFNGETVQVDPSVGIGYRMVPFLSGGERTTWSPDLIMG